MKLENTQLTFPTDSKRKFSPEAQATMDAMQSEAKFRYVPTPSGDWMYDYDLAEALGKAKTPQEKQAAINKAWKD